MWLAFACEERSPWLSVSVSSPSLSVSDTGNVLGPSFSSDRRNESTFNSGDEQTESSQHYSNTPILFEGVEDSISEGNEWSFALPRVLRAGEFLSSTRIGASRSSNMPYKCAEKRLTYRGECLINVIELVWYRRVRAN